MDSVLMPSASIWMPDAPVRTVPTPRNMLRATVRALGGDAALRICDRFLGQVQSERPTNPDLAFAMSDAGSSQTQLLRYTNTNYSQAPILQGSATAGSYFYSLHNASPGHAGTQNTNETAYTNYGRESIARSGSGYTAGGTTDPVAITNAAALTYPACGATGDTLTYFAVGSLTSGAGVVYIFAPLTAQLVVSNGITPSFPLGDISDTLT